MATVYLIACASTKLAHRAKAKDLYISTLFKLSREYAECQNPDEIFVISALHHLLDWEKFIEPYDVTLSYVPPKKRKPQLIVLDKEERKAWGIEVAKKLRLKYDLKKDKLVALAGKNYIEPLRNAGVECQDPLKGLGQGKRLKELKRLTRNCLDSIKLRTSISTE